MKEEDKILIIMIFCFIIICIITFMLRLTYRLDGIDHKLNTIIESVEAAPLHKFTPETGTEKTPEEPSDDEIVISLLKQYQEDVDIVADIQAKEEVSMEAPESEPASESPNIEGFEEYIEPEPTWTGPKLTASMGVNSGPSGKETYYNLPMDGCIQIMRSLGYSEEEYPYWIREDGCKMLGDYVMVAANLSIRPKGTIIESSLGKAIVVDTGYFAYYDSTQIDICVTW
jgi:hypothetical protein